MSETDLVVERVLNAPRHLVWKAYTTPEHLMKWWCPKPYETPACEMEVWPGGKFYTKMAGPDGFEFEGTGCFLEVVEGEKIVWTSALRDGYRPNAPTPGGFVFTAIVTLSDAGNGKTLYHVVAMHADPDGAQKHATMGFNEGWGTAAEQLGEVARSLS